MSYPKSWRRGRWALGALLLATSSIAVAQTSQPSASTPARVIVEHDAIQVSTIDVEASLRDMPETQRRSTQATVDGMGALANDLFVRRALAQRARDEGIGRDALDQAALAIATDRALSDLLLARIDAASALNDEQALAKARELYDANPQRFEAPERVRARHILLAPPNNEQARQKAEQVLALAKAPGADFAALAREHSSDFATAREGGSLGVFGREHMVPAFTEAAFALQPGQLSPVVHTPFGYHVILVEERYPAGPRAFDELKDVLMRQARQEAVLDGRRQAVDAVLKDASFHAQALEPLVVRPPAVSTK